MQREGLLIADQHADTDLGGCIFRPRGLPQAPGNPHAARRAGLHTTFNFDARLSESSADSLRVVIDHTLPAHAAGGALSMRQADRRP